MGAIVGGQWGWRYVLGGLGAPGLRTQTGGTGDTGTGDVYWRILGQGGQGALGTLGLEMCTGGPSTLGLGL